MASIRAFIRRHPALFAAGFWACAAALLCAGLVSSHAHLPYADRPANALRLHDAIQPAPQKGETNKHRPSVRLAEADAWIEALRTGAYWKQRSDSPKTQAPAKPRGGSTRAVPGSSAARASFPATGRVFSYRAREGTTYRTVCVRLCDGFYWPLSFATTTAGLRRDSEICRGSCASPAALHYYPNPGGELEDMVTLDGQPYVKLASAFLYRTTYQPNCKCRPHPWEEAAIERHQGYAESEPTGPNPAQAER